MIKKILGQVVVQWRNKEWNVIEVFSSENISWKDILNFIEVLIFYDDFAWVKKVPFILAHTFYL